MGKSRHLITWFYRALTDMAHGCPGATKSRWERDLGLQIEDRDWNTCLEQVRRVSRNSRMKYTQFNYLHQCYLDPAKIAKMFGGTPKTCTRCNWTCASFYHMVWECTTVGAFWNRVISHINRTLNRDLPLSPIGCLLGVLKRQAGKKVGNRITDLELVVARKSIVKHWKSPLGPSYEGWVQEMGRWCRAEEELLIKEERMGVRLQLLSPLWKEIVEAFALAAEDNNPIASEHES